MRGLTIGFAAMAISLLASETAQAQQVKGARVRVVDVGNGLCVLAQTPDGHTLLFDAGNWKYAGKKPPVGYCLAAVREFLPNKSDQIDVVVLSHSDGDHIGELSAILKDRKAKRVYFPGDDHLPKPTATVIAGSRKAINESGAQVYDLLKLQGPRFVKDAAGQYREQSAPNNIDTVRKVKVGDFSIHLLAGWGDADWVVGDDEEGAGSDKRTRVERALEQGEHNNAVSLVVRFEYRGHSVLLTGDTVGRHGGMKGDKCMFAERIMLETVPANLLKNDVLIGQHHGGDNGSCSDFLKAVKPDYVVFSAGHVCAKTCYRHPRTSTVTRMLAKPIDIKPEKIFRTDRGDDEPYKVGTPLRDREWITGAIKGCVDPPGDDDVEIILPTSAGADVTVAYLKVKATCQS